ncbi:MAG TPA: hypothetical protein VJO32_02445, partial [Ktedonobacteraceae bacterium]|nr:hypothetical protein [Ktedonobacteraceae bacterium]
SERSEESPVASEILRCAQNDIPGFGMTVPVLVVKIHQGQGRQTTTQSDNRGVNTYDKRERAFETFIERPDG